MSDDTRKSLVFISYARKDGQAAVQHLDTMLPKNGFATWRDERGIDPAKDFTAEIERAIEASDRVVVCITPDVRRDDSFVRREISYAQILKKPVIVARFADVLPPIQVINNTWVDYFEAQEWIVTDPQLCAVLKKPAEQLPHTPPQHDPFRAYVEWLYERMVELLRKMVIQLIDLDVKTDPHQVAPPPRRAGARDIFEQRYLPRLPVSTLQTPPDEEVPNFDSFAAAYEYYDGRLLLLGDPGAGKSITLIAFARDAAARRLDDPNAPLPVFGVIATWDAEKQTPLADWLAESHSALNAVGFARTIADGNALLLLDGLDELGGIWRSPDDENRDPALSARPSLGNPQKYREEMVKATSLSTGINPSAIDPWKVVEKQRVDLARRVRRKTTRSYDPRKRFLRQIPVNNRLVISCRVEDYAQIGERAALAGAVILQPLSDDQIRAYLAHDTDLLAAILADDDLRAMVRTPLIMSLFAFAYRDHGDAAGKLRDLRQSSRLLRRAIFDRYVKARYHWEETRTPPPFSLDVLIAVLSDVATASVLSGIDDTLPFSNFVIALAHLRAPKWGWVAAAWDQLLARHQEAKDFVAFASQLGLIRDETETTIRFTHALLRLHFANVQDVFSVLNHQSGRQLHNAIDAAGLIGDAAASLSLTELLGHKDPEVRRKSAVALEHLGQLSTVPLLLQALHDFNEAVSESAAEALGRIAAVAAVPDLVAMLNDGTGISSYRTASSLAMIGEPAVPALVQALKDSTEMVSYRIADTLVKIGEPAVLVLVQALNEDNWLFRSITAEILVRIGAPAVPALIHIIRTVAWRGNSPTDEVPRLIGVLAIPAPGQELSRHYWDPRQFAVVVLGRIGDVSAVPVLLDVLKDDSIALRSRAIEALGEIGDVSVVPALIGVLQDSIASTRVRATEALGRIGDVSAVPALITALSDDSWQVRECAAQVLHNIGDASAVPALTHALTDDHSEVRRRAAEALGQIRDVTAVPALIAALTDNRRDIRSRAAGALKRIATPEALEAVRQYRANETAQNSL